MNKVWVKKTIRFLFFVLFFNSIHINKSFTQAILNANGPGNTYELINSVLAPNNIAIETPDECSSHPSFGRHVAEVWDATLNQYVFEFYIHVPTTTPVVATTADNDRCVYFDRQRVEIKTYEASPDSLKGTSGEMVHYKWKFKLPQGFQPSPNFTHIHQVKAVGGDDGDPLFTLTPRYSSSGNTLQLIYVKDSTSGTTTYTTAPLSNFLGVWVEVTERILIGTNGTYSVHITRVSDGTTLLTYSNNNIQTIRSTNAFIRPKWGIYRSLNSATYLRDDSLRLNSISIYEGLPPTTPTALSATALNTAQIKLTWLDNSNNESNFFVERSLNGTTGWTTIKTVSANVTTLTDSTLQASTTYYYRVRSENPAGTSAYSNIANATTLLATPILNLTNNANTYINVYPNPASELLTVEIKGITLNNTELLIVNDIAQKIKQQKINENYSTFSLKSFSKGVYYIKLLQNKNVIATQSFQVL